MQNRKIRETGLLQWAANNLKQEVKLNDSKEPFVFVSLVFMFHNSYEFPPQSQNDHNSTLYL